MFGECSEWRRHPAWMRSLSRRFLGPLFSGQEAESLSWLERILSHRRLSRSLFTRPLVLSVSTHLSGLAKKDRTLIPRIRPVMAAIIQYAPEDDRELLCRRMERYLDWIADGEPPKSECLSAATRRQLRVLLAELEGNDSQLR